MHIRSDLAKAKNPRRASFLVENTLIAENVKLKSVNHGEMSRGVIN